MDVKERALQAHEKWGGKIEVVARCEVNSKDDLSIAYTPGVAEPCLKIKEVLVSSVALSCYFVQLRIAKVKRLHKPWTSSTLQKGVLLI